jgi:tRNA1(Val) A37 N6-methylase TrmN6
MNGPPKDLLNWASEAARKKGLRPTMLDLARGIARARGANVKSSVASLPDGAPVDWIGQVYETLIVAKTRRKRGVHFTPPEVAAEVVEATLAPLKGKALRTIDPAMGCGAFLLAVARLRPEAELFGFDIDPLATEFARHSLAIETGRPIASFTNLRTGDALLEATGKFDAVIGNPPFGNAIEKRTARSATYAAKMRERYPEFAQGAYDTCLLFFALATKLLAPEGRYGLIAPTALLSDAKPWQQFMRERFQPRALFLYPVNHFGAARIRTTAYIGGVGPCDSVEVRDHDGASKTLKSWRPGTWNETVQDSPHIETTRVLGDYADVFAGCATGAAYELKPLVKESSPRAAGPRLITTGALDRYRCNWGNAPIRFLGTDYVRPVWPAKGPRSVMAALKRQTCPKILVGGLTSVIEAWFDETGNAAGVVSTWVVVPKPGVDPWVLLALLNSATLSRIYMARHGAKSMSGRQTTIYKRGLQQLPMPDLKAPYAAPLRAAARNLQSANSEHHAEALGRELHITAAGALGRTEAEGLDDYQWWLGRVSRTSTAATGSLFNNSTRRNVRR